MSKTFLTSLVALAMILGIACVSRLPIDASPCPCPVGYCCVAGKCSARAAASCEATPSVANDASSVATPDSHDASGGNAGAGRAGDGGSPGGVAGAGVAGSVAADGSANAVAEAADGPGADAPAIDAGVGDGSEVGGHLVFVTSASYSGALGGLEGADAKCQALAEAGHLPGRYLAWLSDSFGSPATRFSRSADPYQLVDGHRVADSWAALTTAPLRHAIDLTEMGRPPTLTIACGGIRDAYAWTNTTRAGTLTLANTTCSDWASELGGAGFLGTSSSQDLWTQSCSTPCGTSASLYCFEQ